jgi:predicted ATPase with chaperone activity
MLVGAMNPCRCGRASEPGFTCSRRPNARCAADYQTRISGPLIDRIDLDGADKVGRVHLAEALSYRAPAHEIRRAA